jgi:hypothetical protein
MDGARCWSVEAKAFEVLVKGGESGVRIYEKSKHKRSSIFVRREELAWLVDALEKVAETEKAETYWDQSRAGLPRILTQKRSNRHGRFLSIEEFDGRRRIGSIIIPEGRYGQGWARLMVELDGADSLLWEGRKSGEFKKEAVEPGWQRRTEASKSRFCLEKDCLHGKGGSWQVTPETTLSEATSSEKAHGGMPATMTQGQAGGVPGTEQLGVAICGGIGSAGSLGGANSKGRWLQALLSPAPNVQGMRQTQQGQMKQGGLVHSEKDVPAINAIEELYNCRGWLRRLRGEVEAGLQRLDTVLQHVSITGPVQDRRAMNGVSRPIRVPEPRGKKLLIPKGSHAGLGLGPKVRGGLPTAGLGLKVSSAGPVGLVSKSDGAFVGLIGGEGSGLISADPKLLTRPAGFDEVGPPGLADGRLGKHVPTVTPTTLLSGSKAPEGSYSEKGGVSEVGCTVSTRTKGTAGLVQRPPAMDGMESTLSSPVRSQIGALMPTDPPQSQLRVYQRSRGRVLKSPQSRLDPGLTGHTSGSSAAVSPVRLTFDGVGTELCDSEVESSATENLGAVMGSADFVPETVAGEDLSDQEAASGSADFVPETAAGESVSSKSVARSGEAVDLNFTLHVGGIMGMTCDGKVEQLKEVVGNLVAEKHGRGVAGERGSQVSDEL